MTTNETTNDDVTPSNANHRTSRSSLHSASSSGSGFLPASLFDEIAAEFQRERELLDAEDDNHHNASGYFDENAENEDQYVDIENADPPSPPRMLGERPKDDVFMSNSNTADYIDEDTPEEDFQRPLNDAEQPDPMSPPQRRISFECHASAIFDQMAAGGEFADEFHSDSDDDEDYDDDDDESENPQENSSPRLPSTPILRLYSSSGSTTNNARPRTSSSMASLASMSEEDGVKRATSFVSKIDRYILQREMKKGSSIVRTQSELAMKHMRAFRVSPTDAHSPSSVAFESVQPTFTRRGQRHIHQSRASANDLPSTTVDIEVDKEELILDMPYRAVG
jgi:hypothetical protein